MTACTIAGCGRPTVAHGLCSLQALHHRDARTAGEALDFVRRPGTGPRITSDTIQDHTGVTWTAWRQRVFNGTAPAHDGRVDGQRFWWASTIQQAR